jgi:hypothetical protein
MYRMLYRSACCKHEHASRHFQTPTGCRFIFRNFLTASLCRTCCWAQGHHTMVPNVSLNTVVLLLPQPVTGRFNRVTAAAAVLLPMTVLSPTQHGTGAVFNP